MLVTDPKQRATMHEVSNHVWMTKGYTSPPDNYLPLREPLTVPLDPDIINAMTGFNFGSPESIKTQLTRTIESEDYQRAVRLYQRDRDLFQPSKEVEKRRGFGFDFYRRRNSGNSRDNLSTPSSEGLQLGSDPLNAFNPLISIYYLVRERKERERASPIPHSAPPTTLNTKDVVATPEITAPREAHINTAAYEMPGEKSTGGRARPRARTHGEDEMPGLSTKPIASPTKVQPVDGHLDARQKKEGPAVGLLRRFSTRKRKEPERLDKDRSHPPVVHVHSPVLTEPPPTPRKSFSIRRSRRDRDEYANSALHTGGSQPQHSDLLSPPLSSGGGGRPPRSGLGRSTSVNSADLRRRGSARVMKDPPSTSGTPRSTNYGHNHPENGPDLKPRSSSVRAKSLGHARRESIQRRRLLREEAREANVLEETDQENGEHSGFSTDRLDSSDLAKPVYLKGLFSVSTTSPKSVPEIRAELKRVLTQLGVEYAEIRGGFCCRHTPSIDLRRVVDHPTSPPAHTPGHRRRFSFGGLRGGNDRDRDESRELDNLPVTPRTPHRGDAEAAYSNSDISDTSGPPENATSARRAAGETTTHVQSDLGGSMVLEFEIFIVKVPLLSLHGIQFKRMVGNTWQYKSMADQILREVRL